MCRAMHRSDDVPFEPSLGHVYDVEVAYLADTAVR